LDEYGVGNVKSLLDESMAWLCLGGRVIV
jgi:hypothetical protein